MKESLHVAQLDATTCSGPLGQNPCLAKRLYALDVLYELVNLSFNGLVTLFWNIAIIVLDLLHVYQTLYLF